MFGDVEDVSYPGEASFTEVEMGASPLPSTASWTKLNPHRLIDEAEAIFDSSRLCGFR